MSHIVSLPMQLSRKFKNNRFLDTIFFDSILVYLEEEISRS